MSSAVASSAVDEASSFTRRARAGAFWSIAGFGGAQVLRFASNLILTRLLAREAFGLMALVWVLLLGLTLFSDIGIGPAIIQNRLGADRHFLRTAFTLQACRGLLLWLAACVAAVPFAHFYRDARLARLVPLVGATALMQGVQSTKIFTATRSLSLKQSTVVDLASQISGIMTMVLWARVDPSVGALAAGVLVQVGAKVVLSHAILPGERDGFGWDPALAREMLRFGRWIFVSTVFTFLAGQSDRLIFGRMIPLDMLGVYGIATMLANIPTQALSHVSQAVFFPLFSGVEARDQDLKTEFRRTRDPILLIGAWAACGLLAGGPTAVRLLYDARYAEAGWIVQLSAVGGWFLFLESLNSAAMLAKGKPKWVAGANITKLLAMVALILLGYQVGGFRGAVAATAASEVFRYGVSAIAVSREGLSGWRRDLALTGYMLATGVVVRLAAIRLGAHVPTIVEALFVATAVTALWLSIGGKQVRAWLVSRAANTPQGAKHET